MASPLDGSLPIENDPRDPHSVEATERRIRTDIILDQVVPAEIPAEFPVLDDMATAAGLEVLAATPEPAATPDVINVQPPAPNLNIDFPDILPAAPLIGQEAAIKQAFPVEPRRTFTPRRRASLESLTRAEQRQYRETARIINDMAVDAAEERVVESSVPPPSGPQFPPLSGVVPFDGNETPVQVVSRIGDTASQFAQFSQELIRLLTAISDQTNANTQEIERIRNGLERGRC